MSARKRRLDIDLLRAIAVGTVLLFHFDFPGMEGGFLGVDIFFVLSGYLISLHIKEQRSEGRFKFIDFYLRRIRRLTPALFVACLGTAIASFFILPKPLLEEFSRSFVAANLYVSNIYFWSTANYFDTGSIFKPLLHTWSLGVEEQFYLIWPMFLVFIPKRFGAWFVLAAGVISLIASEIVLNYSASSGFYLFPFRIFQFATGAMVAYITLPKLNFFIRQALLLIAAAVIIASFVLTNEFTRNPGFSALPIVMAVAVIIALNEPWLNKEHPISEIWGRIGLVSYSAYLVHWPLVVLYKINNPAELNIMQAGLFVVVSYVIAELLYTLVEKPTQKIPLEGYRKAWIGWVVLMALIAIGFMFIAQKRDEILGRDNKVTVASLLDAIPPNFQAYKDFKAELATLQAADKVEKTKKIVVLGDSLASDVNAALAYQALGTPTEVGILHSNCDPLAGEAITVSVPDLYAEHPIPQTRQAGFCEKYHEAFLGSLVKQSPDLVIFSEAWRRQALPYMSETIRLVQKNTSANVLVLGVVPAFFPHPNVAFRDVEKVEDLNAAAETKRVKGWDDMDPVLRQAALDNNAMFVAKRDIVCPTGPCDILSEGQITYHDGMHWNRSGMLLFGKRLAERPELKEYFKKK